MHQFEAIATPRFLTSIAVALYKERNKPGVTADKQLILSALVTKSVSHTIEKVALFAPKKTGGPMIPDAALQVIELSLGTRNIELVKSITDRLTDTTNVSDDVMKRRVRELLLPLLPLVDAKLKASSVDSAAVPGITDLYETTVERGLSFMLSGASASPKSDLALLVEACTVCASGGEILHKRSVHL